jgi:hypothetical protein
VVAGTVEQARRVFMPLEKTRPLVDTLEYPDIPLDVLVLVESLLDQEQPEVAVQYLLRKLDDANRQVNYIIQG